MWTRSVFFAAALLLATGALAEPKKPVFSEAHLYPAFGQVGVGFFTLTSHREDAITAVSSDCCSAIEIHRTEKLNGVMSMRKTASLTIPEDEPVDAQPKSKSGLHLMLIGIKKSPLKEGDSVDITFTFKNAGAETVHFAVKAPAKGEETGDSAHSRE